MATIDYGDGPHEFTCTGWTQVIYEQQFHSVDSDEVGGDLISDVMGKLFVTSEDVLSLTEDGLYARTVVDYTRINWNAIRRGLWSMMKTAEEIADDDNKRHERVPSYKAWERSLLRLEPDMQEMASLVMQELQRGLFRAGAAASGKTSEEEEA